MKFNERLERIQKNRDNEVPIESNKTLWLLWINSNFECDSDSLVNWKAYINELKQAKICFCVWKGQYKTNLFLMNISKLVIRLKNMENGIKKK